jgi:crotonobetainyl-CoA:carnitine CoA-transferase CaiB-like acyl-CoA transferase
MTAASEPARPAPSGAPPLAGVRVIEVSLLGPGAVGTHLADLGADVIKVEPPGGDYIRQMTWPIIEGSSLLHWHIHRGKRSVTLDLRTEEGQEVFRDLVRDADAVIEAMRPGALARRGLGYEDLLEINPRIVFCTISGYGMTGPYANLPSHGIAYDTWAGIVNPAYNEDGFPYLPEHASIGIHAGPLFGSLGVLAGIIKARATGEGSYLEIAQSDAAAAMDWLRSETWKAYERPEDEVTGNASDNYERRAPGTAGMEDGVRYQVYESKDGFVLFMASEQEFWRNFCEGVGRMDLFERWPGNKYGDHAKGNTELRKELAAIFKTRTSAEWVEWSGQVNTTIAPVNTPKTLADDPQFQARLGFMPHETHGADMIGTPLKFIDAELPDPTPAPAAGEHNDEVLAEVLGYDAERIAALRAAGALGEGR